MIFETVLLAASLAAGAGSLSLVGYLRRHWEKPGAKWFVLSLSGQAVFCFTYALGLFVSDLLVREWLEIVSIVALSWLGVPFLGFALAYTGRTQITRSWPFQTLFIFPVVATVLLPLNGVHGLFWSDFDVAEVAGLTVGAYSPGPLLFLTILGGSTVAGIGAVLLFDTVWSYGRLYRSEALAVALSPVPPGLGLLAWLFGLGPLSGFNWAVALFLPHVLLDGYAFVGSGMFDFHPSTSRAAERSALDDLPQPVFVLDQAGRIVEMNPAAAETFEVEESEVITREVSSVVGADIGPATADQRISVETGERPYEFRVDSSKLMDSAGSHVGYLLFFQDVTAEIQREERLAVLNRVLRHNLRNELSIARGYISVAEDEISDRNARDGLERAGNALDELLETSEQARTIEKTLGSTVIDRRTVALEELLGAECDNVADRAAVSLSCPPVEIQTEPAVLGTVVGELLDNAIEHTDAEEPTITVTVDNADELRITIEDDGPGIAEHEREALERGDETALGHGSGLGLWLTKWGANRLGGEIDFAVVDTGTRVTLTFPPATVVGQSPSSSGGAAEPARADGAGVGGRE